MPNKWLQQQERLRVLRQNGFMDSKKQNITNHGDVKSTHVTLVSYPASRGPSIFLDKSGRGRDPSRKIEGPLLAGY